MTIIDDFSKLLDQPTSETAAKAMTLKQAQDTLKTVGMTLKFADDEYAVNFKGGKEATVYYTDDMADALATGKQMAAGRNKTTAAMEALIPETAVRVPNTGRRSLKSMMQSYAQMKAAKKGGKVLDDLGAQIGKIKNALRKKDKATASLDSLIPQADTHQVERALLGTTLDLIETATAAYKADPSESKAYALNALLNQGRAQIATIHETAAAVPDSVVVGDDDDSIAANDGIMVAVVGFEDDEPIVIEKKGPFTSSEDAMQSAQILAEKHGLGDNIVCLK